MNEEKIVPDDPDTEIAKLRAVYQKLVDKNEELRKRELHEENRLNGTSVSDYKTDLSTGFDEPPIVTKVDNYFPSDPEKIDDGFIDSTNHSPNKDEQHTSDIMETESLISNKKKSSSGVSTQEDCPKFCYFCYLSEWEQPSGYKQEIQEDEMDTGFVDWLEDAFDET